MVKRTLGYVELEWECPQCGTRNPGPQRFCSSCGSPQPQKADFKQAAEEKLITDADQLAQAQAGADVHCAFCGARNPAGAAKCVGCGASLETAAARVSGQVLGAHRDKPAAPVNCPQCGATNPAAALKCQACGASLRQMPAPAGPRPAQPAAGKPAAKMGAAVGVAVLLFALLACAACVLMMVSLIPKEEVIGQVERVSWERSIDIERLQDVTKSDWKANIPRDARLGSCTYKHHHTQDNPAPNATEVCGTPYTVDKGSGYGEVVQDCKYAVYQEHCNYTVPEWRKADTVRAAGNDFNPYWPAVNPVANERVGSRYEQYQVFFSSENKNYTYSTSEESKFRQFTIGSRWKLQIGLLGGVQSVQPAQ